MRSLTPNMGDLVQREHPPKLGLNRGGVRSRPGSESIQVDLRILSRVESILLTSTTGFVDLSRFCFKSTWKRLNALLLLFFNVECQATTNRIIN